MDKDYLKEVLNAIQEQFRRDHATYRVRALERKLTDFDRDNSVEEGIADKVREYKAHVKTQLQTLTANQQVHVQDNEQPGDPHYSLSQYVSGCLDAEPPKPVDKGHLDNPRPPGPSPGV